MSPPTCTIGGGGGGGGGGAVSTAQLQAPKLMTPPSTGGASMVGSMTISGAMPSGAANGAASALACVVAGLSRRGAGGGGGGGTGASEARIHAAPGTPVWQEGGGVWGLGWVGLYLGWGPSPAWPVKRLDPGYRR